MLNELPVPATGAVAPAAEADPPPMATPKRRTLMDLVVALAHADDDLAAPDFDPAELVGNIREKVDSVHFVVERMESVATWLRGIVRPLASKASALTNNRERLRAYVVECLLTERACRIEMGEATEEVSLPGDAFKVRLRDSNEALEVARAATAEDFERFPDFVEMKRAYVWKEPEIKAALKAGVKLPVVEVDDPNASADAPEGGKIRHSIPARLTQGHWPEWVPNVPEKLEPTKKGRKKKS